MKEVTAYVCDFCPKRKARLSKGHTKRHEEICFHNPARKACASCGHFVTFNGHADWDGPLCKVAYFNPVGEDDSPSAMFRSDCAMWEPDIRKIVTQIRTTN